ncbi:MAG: ROK family protein [Terriglobia bacterium]
MKALAIDLGGSHATCALVEDRTILASRTVSTDGTAALAPQLPLLAESLQALLVDPRGSTAAPAGLAFSFCGLVDCVRHRIAGTNAKYDDGPGLDLVAWCRESLGIAFKMDNDARMALLGEWYAGAARGYDDVIMITLGTGIGGAAMIQGRLVRGKHSQAGCLGGHMPVDFNGRTCTCGAVGCAEAEASTVALPGVCRSHPSFASSALAAEPSITYARLFYHAGQGDQVAQEICDRSMRVWGTALVGLIHAYDPEVIVVGGGIMKSGDRIIPFLQSYVERYAWTPWGKVKVCSAELGNDAALLGAVPLLQGLADL